MKNVRVLLVFFAVLLLAVSCKKGDNGKDGVNGNTILSGMEAPNASLGNTGDFYIDLATSVLYGPKTAGGWGSGSPLKGPEGNANVLTDSFTVKPDDWVWGSIYYTAISSSGLLGYQTKYYDRSNTKITPDILNHGLVLVYYKSATVLNPNQWQPLPYMLIVGGAAYSYNWAFETFPGKVRLHFYFAQINDVSPDVATAPMPESAYKIVVISGATGNSIIQTLKQTHTGIN